MLEAFCTRCATPSLARASPTRDWICAETASTLSYAAWSSRRSWARPAAVAVGVPGGGAGCGGERVTGEGARLVDRPDGREVLHAVGPAAEGGGGEATAHHLAEGHQ